MEELKRLIEQNDDVSILNHVKNDLYPKIDFYTSMSTTIADMQNEILKLKANGLERQMELEKYKRLVDDTLKNLKSV